MSFLNGVTTSSVQILDSSGRLRSTVQAHVQADKAFFTITTEIRTGDFIIVPGPPYERRYLVEQVDIYSDAPVNMQHIEVHIVESQVPTAPQPSKTKGHAFISYVREDHEAVNQLQNALEEAGISVWIDVQKLWGGDDWPLEIRRAITDESIAVVAVFSKNSIARDKTYQHEELNLAVAEQRLRPPGRGFIIPVRLDNCEIPDYSIHAGQSLGSINRVDLFPNFEAGASKVAASVLRILDNSESSNEVAPETITTPQIDAPKWLSERRDLRYELLEISGPGWFEIAAYIDPPVSSTRADLLEAVRKSTIPTFGWPLGVALRSGSEAPSPTNHGIAATVLDTSDEEHSRYDDWELRTDGSYHLIKDLFEDQRNRNDAFFLDTRIVRITETLLFLRNLYENLGADGTSVLYLDISHGGLTGRYLRTASPARDILASYRCSIDEVSGSLKTPLNAIDVNLVNLVKSVGAPLFEMFDFFVLGDNVYEEMVTKYATGETP